MSSYKTSSVVPTYGSWRVYYAVHTMSLLKVILNARKKIWLPLDYTASQPILSVSP